MQQQKKEKVRIFALARELGMESKDLVVFCQQHGLDVKSQLSTIEPEVREQILQLVKKPAAAPPPPPPVAAAAAPPVPRKVQTIQTTKRPTAPAPAREPAAQSVAVAAPPVSPEPPASVAPTAAPVEEAPVTTVAVVPAAPPPVAPVEVPAAPAVRAPVTPPTPAAVTPASPPAPVAPAAPPKQTPPVRTTAASPPPIAAPRPATPAVPSQEKPLISAEPTTPPTPAAKQPEQPAPRQAEPAAPAPRAPETPKATPPTAAPQRPPQTPQPTRPVQPSQGQTPAQTPPARPAATGTAPPRPPIRSVTPIRPIGQSGQGGQGGPGGGQPSQGTGTGQTGNRPQRPSRPSPGQYGTTISSRPIPAKPQAGSTTQQPPKQAAGQQSGIKKLGEITPEMMAQFAGQETPPTPAQLEGARQKLDRQAKAPPGGAPAAPAPAAPVGEDDDDRGRGRSGAPATGAVPGREDRHKARSERQKARKGSEQEGRGGKILMPGLDDEPKHRKSRPHLKKHKIPGTVGRLGKIPVYMPITVRSFSEAIGKKAMDVIFKLKMDHNVPAATINSSIEPDLAELLALAFDKEIEIKRAVDIEGITVKRAGEQDKLEDLVPRAPIVTIMGHVDHGKTSLLDRIRETYGLKSDVVSTEAGGITQVIRAWRVEKDGHPITFLDTPGHEAFTKMRARGANVTDVAVIVVAANDGVMPQTEEAISHAKAAGVSIVVAINKVDLPDANLGRTERRLMELGLIPDTMGGEVPFVKTSAKTGLGIDDLLEQLSVVAELKELKANPNKSATGTCLEAYKSEKEGVQATLLVREGTLRTGDVVLCGSSYGNVRRMYDDLGRTIEEAGPSVPVRILGLDKVPNADDPFLVVDDLSVARQIAEDRKVRDVEQSQVRGQKVFDLADIKKVTELKVILKAEARGSIEAIRNELEKLQHEEVRVNLLHAAIGAITVSDVTLALTSPENTLVVGFNVVPDNDAKALAEERGIQIKQYNIIYQLADDIKSALEGKLKPREEVVQLGRAIVRNTFKISRVGTIAGCYVTQGNIERNAKIRVIRQGLVVYPPQDRTASLESLKRFKEDAREVREGFECGLKIAGYDDIKVDDVIECYRIDQVQRTLDKS